MSDAGCVNCVRFYGLTQVTQHVAILCICLLKLQFNNLERQTDVFC